MRYSEHVQSAENAATILTPVCMRGSDIITAQTIKMTRGLILAHYAINLQGPRFFKKEFYNHFFF